MIYDPPACPTCDPTGFCNASCITPVPVAPAPALPVEVWRDTTRSDPDYMQAVRSLCGG